MTALAHHPVSAWIDRALSSPYPQTQMRGLVAAHLRREPLPSEQVGRVIGKLAAQKGLGEEDQLDLLRVIALFQGQLGDDTKTSVRTSLLTGFPSANANLRWEQIRLLGEFRHGFAPLLRELERSGTRGAIHIAQAIAKLANGWSEREAERLVRWFP